MTCPPNFLSSSEIEAVRSGKASFHYYFPRLGFFSLQSLYSIFLLAFLCKTVLLDCLEKTVHIFEPSRENYYFSKSKGNGESMLSNNKDDKGGENTRDSESRSVSSVFGLQQAFNGNKIFFLYNTFYIKTAAI